MCCNQKGQYPSHYWNPYQQQYYMHDIQPYGATYYPVNTHTFTPDQWVRYIDPLVEQALQEVKQGINLTHLFQEFILSGVLVGLGYTPQMAITQVEQWEKGESQLLQQSKNLR